MEWLRTGIPAVISTDSLLPHVYAELYEITRMYVVDVGVAWFTVFRYCVIMLFVGIQVVPLIRTVGGLFRVKILHRVPECVESDGAVGYDFQSVSFFVGKREIAHVCAMAVFLWAHVWIVHLLGCCGVDSKHGAVVAVNVVLPKPRP